MAKVTFNESLCKGCSLCVNACPKKIVKLKSELNAKGYYPATVEETAPTANQEKVKVSAINFEFNGFLSVVLGLLIAYILVL